MSAFPRALKAWMLLILAALAALYLAETWAWRPGYAHGDEARFISRLQLPLDFTWAQGSLYRSLIWAWSRSVGTRLGALHIPGLLILALELFLLFRLARRWLGEGAAWWALMLGAVAAGTWIQARSLLSHQLQPLWALAFCLGAAQVRGPRTAAGLGALAALAALDYEGSLVALPLAFLACWRLEPGFRRQAQWTALAAALVGALLLLGRPEAARDYWSVRQSVSIGDRALELLPALLANLKGALWGGEPQPYMGIQAWPVLPYWAWAGLLAGAWQGWHSGRRSLLAWAALAFLITLASKAPAGLPSQRLVTAWPATCLLGGLGLERLRLAAGRWGPALGAILLSLGLLSEAHAYARHMGRHGASVYGASLALDQAVALACERAQAQGCRIQTRLLEWRESPVWLHARGRPCAGAPDGDCVLQLAEAGLRRPLQALAGGVELIGLRQGLPPVALALARGAAAERLMRVDAGLARVQSPIWQDPYAQRARIQSALSGDPGMDPLLWTSLVQRDLALSFESGMRLERSAWDLAMRRPLLSPAPYALLGQHYLKADAGLALQLGRRALALDPLFAEAAWLSAAAAQALGRSDEADAVIKDWRAAQAAEQGAP